MRRLLWLLAQNRKNNLRLLGVLSKSGETLVACSYSGAESIVESQCLPVAFLAFLFTSSSRASLLLMLLLYNK